MHIEFPKLKRDEPTLGEGAQVNKTTFGQWVELGDRTLADNCTIGDYTYTGQNCYLQNSDLKRFISIAAQVRIGPTNHPYNRASQHVFAYNGTTLVTHDVEPYTIVGGVSAKKIKDRFPDEIKADLEKIAWWDWSREQLEANYLDFRLPIEEFVQKHLHA